MLNLGFIDRLSRRTGEIVCYVFLVSVGIMVWEVGARYLFGMPTIWAHEATICLTALGFVFGGVYTMQRREHIRITAIYDISPPAVRRLFDLLALLVILFYLAALLYAGWLVASRALAVMETSGSAWNQPIPVVLKTALVIGTALMGLQAITHLLQHLRLARRSDPGTRGDATDGAL